jgi:hypothetical protein
MDVPLAPVAKANALTVTTAASWLFTIDHRVFFQDQDGQIHEATEAERCEALRQLSIPLAAYSGTDT